MTTKSIEDAQKVLAELEAKLAAAKAAAVRIAEDSKNVSFDAHTGDASARKRLDDLYREGVAAGLEVNSLEIAVGEARGHVQAAMDAADDEAAKERARTALALLVAFGERGAALDQALSKFIDAYGELSRDFHALEKIGYAPTSFALVQTNMRNATASRLMFTDLQMDFLPPDRRHSFAECVEGWSANVRRRAEARLNGTPASKAA